MIDVKRLAVDAGYWDEVAPEWVGLPPVGCECEMYPYFHKCRIVCKYMDGLVIHDLHDDQLLHASKGEYRFRPIPTPEQRQREELIDLIGKQRPTIAELAEAILSRYTLEEKQ